MRLRFLETLFISVSYIHVLFLGISSPTQSVVDENEITDLLHKREENRSIAADMIEAKQSAPWTSLFTGALNRPVTKVTKLQDVQNIATPTSTRPRAYARARSLDLDSHRYD